MDSLGFHYNGRHSSEFGVYMVSLSSGLNKTPYLANKKILSEKIVGNLTPYTFGVDYDSLEFKLVLACIDEKWTDDRRREIARWLDTSAHEEFYADDTPDKYYYFQYQGGVELSHNGLGDGYIEITMLNDSPYAYSPIQERRYDLEHIKTPTVIEFENMGDDLVYPEMWIYNVNKGDLTIRNLSNGGKDFKFTNIVNKETIYVDNQHRHIETDLTLTYRYDNFNNNYLELVRGVNRLEVTGACHLSFKYQYLIKG